jgi:hypothetical protein
MPRLGRPSRCFRHNLTHAIEYSFTLESLTQVKVSIRFAQLLNPACPYSTEFWQRSNARDGEASGRNAGSHFLRYWQSPLREENESVFTVAGPVKGRQVPLALNASYLRTEAEPHSNQVRTQFQSTVLEIPAQS